MDFWIKAAQLILSLSILITLHEFGHYFAARLFKIRIEKFYLFFDPWFALLKKKIGDTEWGIGWLPLGGYVKIAGMVDESMDKEQLAQPAKPDEFRSKPAWQRLIVMIGGVTVNVIVGFFIYILVVAAWGETRIENDQLNYGLAVNKQIRDLNLGFEDGDIITHVEGEPVENVRLVNIQLFLRGARKLEVLKPNGETKTIILNDSIKDFMWENDAIMAFEPRVPIVVDTVMPDSDALAKGLMKGDSIVSINSQPTPFFHNLREHLAEINEETEPILVGFYRSGLFQEIEVEKDSATGTIGFGNQYPAFLTPKTVHYSFGESIARGFSRAKWTMKDYVAQLPLIFTSKGASSVGGFGAIGNLFPSTWNWEVFWLNTAFISLVLAIMNMLPIPALDGGHIVFLIYEMITGREAPQKVLEYAQIVGFIILLGLLVFANGNDVYRAFFK
jgi:regulator of sigma E protease